MQTVEAGQKSATWLDKRAQYVPRGLSSYHNIIVDHAHGAEVWDVDGKHYIDFAGGIGTLNVGHTPQRVVDAVTRQTEKLIHMAFGVAPYAPYIDLAERLAKLVPGSSPKKTLLLNSGAEAVENAIKVARAATGRPAIIAFENSFHGRTLMTMTLTGKEKPYKLGFGPFAPDVYHARYPYAYRSDSDEAESGRDLERLFATTVAANRVAAIIVEPVQGEGGFIVAPPEWLRTLRRIADREGILLIADEVQTGFGRTGQMLAVEHAGIEPDMVVLAKSLADGFPLGAVVGRAEIMDAPGVGGIGGTYGGNPVACAAALAVLDIFEEENLVARARELGQIVVQRFQQMQQRYDLIGEVRGLGAMQAMELVTNRATKEPAKEQTAEIIHRCADDGLIIIKAGLHDNVIRILVPLIIAHDLLNDGLDILERVIGQVA
ncbi:MAG TPA: 4-aminobutyrate--2-oxoglutarate transaminase [Chloroflexota bacterium]|nr:4-aminobutyrate--2-oxoglutarate transaminase [Chloroflexota bacterium]